MNHDLNQRAEDRPDLEAGFGPWKEVGLVFGILSTLYVLALVVSL